MFIDLEQLAPHMLGAFMLALACIPLIFVWQDRGRKRASRERLAQRVQTQRVQALAAGVASSR